MGEASKVATHDKYTISYTTVKESQLPSAFCKVARGIFTTCSPHTVNVHIPATPPKHLSSPSLPIGKLCMHCSCWKVVCRVKMLLTDNMWCAVALNCSLNRHTEYIRQIYMKIASFNLLVCGSLRLAPISSQFPSFPVYYLTRCRARTKNLVYSLWLTSFPGSPR